MFKYVKGDLLESEAHALVNTVNCEGVMGKGLALQFRHKYPQMYEGYVRVCKDGGLKIGMLQIVEVDGKLLLTSRRRISGVIGQRWNMSHRA